MKFEPGKSGNPGGKPKGDNPLKRLCQTLTQETFDEVKKAAFQNDDMTAKLKAIGMLWDRGYGKPVQTLAGDEENPLAIAITEMVINPVRAKQ